VVDAPFEPLLDGIGGILDLHRHAEQVGVPEPLVRSSDELEDGGPLVLCRGVEVFCREVLLPDRRGVEHVHRGTHISAGTVRDLVECDRIACHALCRADLAEAGDDRAGLERPELHRFRGRFEVP